MTTGGGLVGSSTRRAPGTTPGDRRCAGSWNGRASRPRSARASIESIAPEPDDDAVRILTVHGAKGLEFPVVLLAGLSTQPPAFNPPVVWDATGNAEYRVGTKSARAETRGYEAALAAENRHDKAERLRLLYVAMTRRARPPRREPPPQGGCAVPRRIGRGCARGDRPVPARSGHARARRAADAHRGAGRRASGVRALGTRAHRRACPGRAPAQCRRHRGRCTRRRRHHRGRSGPRQGTTRCPHAALAPGARRDRDRARGALRAPDHRSPHRRRHRRDRARPGLRRRRRRPRRRGRARSPRPRSARPSCAAPSRVGTGGGGRCPSPPRSTARCSKVSSTS